MCRTRHGVTLKRRWIKIPGSHLFLRCFFPAAPGAASTLAWVSCCSLWRSSFGEVTLARKKCTSLGPYSFVLTIYANLRSETNQTTRLRRKGHQPGQFFLFGVLLVCFFGQLPPALSSVSLSLSLLQEEPLAWTWRTCTRGHYCYSKSIKVSRVRYLKQKVCLFLDWSVSFHSKL